MIHHRVDGVFQFQDFALYIDRDLLGEITACYCCGNFRNVAYLTGEIPGHEIYTVGQILPSTCHAMNVRLSAKNSFRADLARDAGYLRCKRAELVHHGVDGVFQLQNFPLHINSDHLTNRRWPPRS